MSTPIILHELSQVQTNANEDVQRLTSVERLVVRWQHGEQEAAEQLYGAVRNRTFRLSLGLLGNREDAEEVTQDALTYALLNIGRFDPTRAQFTTWLHTITVSRCRDKHRCKRFSLVALTAWLHPHQELVDTNPQPDQALEQHTNQQQLWDAVQTLAPNLREAIVLRYWAQHSFKEIAAILDCPPRTAQSRVRLGHQKLHRRLEERRKENEELRMKNEKWISSDG